jgi:hypothetical protein
MGARPGIRRLGAALALAASGLAVLGLAGCASEPFEAPLPTPGAVVRLPDIGESPVSLHLNASYAALSAAANRTVAARLEDPPPVDVGHGWTFKLTALRSDISVTRQGPAIGFGTAIHVTGELDSHCPVVRQCTGGLSVDGQIWGKATPALNPDWTLRLDPSSEYAINDAELHVPLLPVNLPVKDQVSRALKVPFDKLVIAINDEVGRTTVLKSAAQGAWTELGHPIAVSADPPVWLMVHPTRILTEQPEITDQGVELQVALIARPELVVGDRPSDQDPGPLPDLNIVPSLPDQFSIYLPVRLTWEDATELAMQNLVGRKLQAAGGVTVEVRQVAIFNNGDEAGVKIAFHATSKSGGWAPDGAIYLLGRPVYHLEDGYIAIENLHLDVRTRDLVLKVAAFLAHQALIDELQSRLRFDMRDQVAARRQDLDKAINATQVAPDISLQGEVSSLAPSAVYLTRTGLQVNVVALGTLRVVMH